MEKQDTLAPPEAAAEDTHLSSIRNAVAITKNGPEAPWTSLTFGEKLTRWWLHITGRGVGYPYDHRGRRKPYERTSAEDPRLPGTSAEPSTPTSESHKVKH